MALFRIGPNIEIPHFVRGDGVYLRPPEMRDFEAWSSLREHSRDFLTPWEPTWPGDDLTRAAFRRRVRRHQQEIESNEAYPFLVFRDDDVLLGGLTLGQIKRGVVQAATLGYWIGEIFANQGFMTRAARAAVAFSFGSLRLHRVEASCLPHNAASMRLLERVGFKREGYARAYLRINGVWEDHLLFGMLESDQTPLRPPRQGKF
ncbi:30S ribosomal protein S5 alanine N-acetyltransferase [Methylocella tundrae]|uniref:30S ribosomal protein S5 alanine N-acetyltransferase n=1 Tax=Methylocella tundrae TaxID=227605 RepID=A0A4U8YXK6_METTU|nr:GNAT family protein [Methylocella tundrae]WPP05113.1 GNAT family protein [Methylocella tundrae]VFU07432.1 30S ribosomal protein S5 alanine N-acetyltransferase [Methylocella tundrae]VTZ22620.1 30S ribosomal protein S5 alanine N-acetyltransferase [Methylocella tundrae]VTZ49156.1 30S ribosomal protein S5 alanine N-acetyltransferase [Methylocella tundrae]